jgi:hypothetical protein
MTKPPDIELLGNGVRLILLLDEETDAMKS